MGSGAKTNPNKVQQQQQQQLQNQQALANQQTLNIPGNYKSVKCKFFDVGMSYTS